MKENFLIFYLNTQFLFPAALVSLLKCLNWELNYRELFFPLTSVKNFCTFAGTFLGGRLCQCWLSCIFFAFFFNVSFQHGKGLPIASVKPNDLFEEYAEVVKVLADEETDLEPCKSERVTIHANVHANYSFKFWLYTDFITKNIFNKYFKEEHIR